MAGWTEILREIQSSKDFDGVRRKYIKDLSSYTGRNVIVYYSGWLQKQGVPSVIINDFDKNAFMATIKGLDRSKGLDLILHTPGGETAATESIIDYLTKMFDDIRVIVPQLAMSGGTMIACASNRILMGKHSSLGPIDPQFQTQYGQIAAHGILEEFKMAYKEIKKDQTKVYLWQPIISKYNPTLIGECQKAVDWAEQIVSDQLEKRMFKGNKDAKKIIKKILKELGDHKVNLTHSRHLSAEKCKEIGLVVESLEDDQTLQDKVLSIHHALMITLAGTQAFKITENQDGAAVVQQVPQLPQQGTPAVK